VTSSATCGDDSGSIASTKAVDTKASGNCAHALGYMTSQTKPGSVTTAPMTKQRAANAVDRHIGARLRERRLEIGMSQEKLAELLGVTFQQIQKYENGVNRIAASRLYDMTKALEVSVAYFFEGLAEQAVKTKPGRK
jgi:DNA-binding XRE family transcriptional regulator